MRGGGGVPEALGGCAALAFSVLSPAEGELLLKNTLSLERLAPLKGTNLISALALRAAVLALWALADRPSIAPVMIPIDIDAAAQILAKGGPNRSLVNYPAGGILGRSRSKLAERTARDEQPCRRPEKWLGSACECPECADPPPSFSRAN